MFAFSLNPIDWVTGAAGWVADKAIGGLFEALVEWVWGGVTGLLVHILDAVVAMTEPDLGRVASAQAAGLAWWIAGAVFVGSVASIGISAIRGVDAIGDAAREIAVTAVILAGWWTVMAWWVEMVYAAMRFVAGDLLTQQPAPNGLVLDPSVPGFLAIVVGFVLIVFLIVFLIELLVLQHLLILAVVLGPIAVGLRPARGLANVSTQMIRNFVTLSLVPVFSLASMSLAMGQFNTAGLNLVQALGAIAGMAVSLLMPAIVSKFVPLGGQGTSSPGRAMLGAGVGAAAGVALLASGVAAGAAGGAARGGGGQLASVITGPTPPGSGPSGGGGSGGGGWSPGGGVGPGGGAGFAAAVAPAASGTPAGPGAGISSGSPVGAPPASGATNPGAMGAPGAGSSSGSGVVSSTPVPQPAPPSASSGPSSSTAAGSTAAGSVAGGVTPGGAPGGSSGPAGAATPPSAGPSGGVRGPVAGVQAGQVVAGQLSDDQ